MTAHLRIPILALMVAACIPAAEPAWSPKAAAAYLDGRMSWWSTWSSSARDHQTFCVSCHTAAPYGIARAALGKALGEQAPSPVEHKLIDNIGKRVNLWSEVEPFYPDATRGVPKTVESRGTESILNALIFSHRDARARKLAPETVTALDNMWAEQLKTGNTRGAWQWLQFHNAPWEGDSQYYGSALAAIAIGTAPEEYSSRLQVQVGLQLLRDYLQRERASQTLHERTVLLWASGRLPGILTAAERSSLIAEVIGKQQADGGFSISSLVGEWKRRDNSPLDPHSDGYATGLVGYALQQAGVPRDRPELKRALDWLARNQHSTEGRWLAHSLNKQRDPDSDVGKFMSDAATAYAVLALTAAK